MARAERHRSSGLVGVVRARGHRARPWSATACAALLAASSVASAQSSPQAEQLFRDGRRLMADRKYAEACAAFDASQRLEPTTATAMNLADCSEKAGLLATAWGWFLDVAAKTRTPEASPLHDAAKRRAAAIEPRLSHLVVRLAEPARVEGLVISLDRIVLSVGAWNRAIPVDGGGHTIEVAAPDRDPWSTRVTVAPERDTVTVDVPALAPASRHASAPLAAVAPLAAAAPLEQAAPSDLAAPQRRAWQVPVALGAVAAAALVGGAVVERAAERAYGQATAEPDDARQRERYDDAVVRRGAAIGLGAVGLAAGGVAVYLLARGWPARPQLVPTGNGVAIAGVFW
jgi:hypothetical protein